MKKIILFIFCTSFSICYSQTKIEGSILNEETNEALGYATIKILNTKFYTITNEDGKFEFNYKVNKNDTLQIRHLGFQPKNVPLSYFSTGSKLYLTPNYEAIDEVIIVGSKNYTYNLLYSLIEKYRNNSTTNKSKAFLSLTSSARNIPIEHIEGFYNSDQSIAKGIINLNIKNGRFGQNKKFSFFSLDNTTIIKDFQFFKNSKQILPMYPGNMSLHAIKSKYKVSLLSCESCDYEDISISFTTKKQDGRLFDGKITFNQKNLVIKKIELGKINPETKGLSSLREDDVLTPKEIKLNIVYNPLDYTKIQYLDFTFINKYQSESTYEIIKSRSFLYFYDYNKPFEEPYFTNKILFKNDYDKIVALQGSEEFWALNYQFPQSYNDIRSVDFLKEHGYLIHYENEIQQGFIKLIKPSVVSWNKNKRLNWNSIKLTIDKDYIKKINRMLRQGEAYEVDNSYNSVSEWSMANSKHTSNATEEFNFSYTLNPYDVNGNSHLTSSTIFDRNTSFYKGERTQNKLIYINITFDIYEYHRLKLERQLAFNYELTYDEIKELYTNTFNEASSIIKKMKTETSSGLDFQNLNKWNEKIKSKLNIDNISLISKIN